MRFLAASLAASGKIGEAQQTASNILSVDPKFSAGRFSERHAFKDAAQRQLFREHLVKAGLPD
jgi:hypothetical protein